MVRKIWNDPVLSKVIAVALAAGGVWMFQHLAVTWPVPGWLLGLLVVAVVGSPLAAVMYLKRRAIPGAHSLGTNACPTLIVKCPKSRELFITNDGPNAAVNVEIGPLVHEEEHEITVLMSPFGSIAGKATEQRAKCVRPLGARPRRVLFAGLEAPQRRRIRRGIQGQREEVSE